MNNATTSVISLKYRPTGLSNNFPNLKGKFSSYLSNIDSETAEI